MPSIVIPFDGFYNSWYSDGVDREEEQYVQNEIDEERTTLDASDLAELVFCHSNHGVVFDQLARDYCFAFDHVISELLEIKLDLKFEEMTSPREYNFETDRIFATATDEVVQKLFSMADGPALRIMIREKHSSRSGFHSFYSNDYDEWIEKGLENWDHNELATLLECVIEQFDDKRDYRWGIYEYMHEDFCNAFEKGVNWPALEAAIKEKEDDQTLA